MKQITLVLMFLVISIKAWADCPMGRVELWPSGNSIYENSLIVINGYGLSQEFILQLNKKYPIFLISGKVKVVLTINEIITTEAGLTQAVLIPAKTLTPGSQYQIFIANIPKDQVPETTTWNQQTNKYEFPIWTVIKGKDIDKPLWKLKPKEVKKTYIQYGCGPEYYVHFNFQVLDQSEILIKTSVTSLSSNKIISCYLKPEDAIELKVGRGMCGGAFSFSDGENFDVTFDVMDASGNITKWIDNKISFTKPTDLN